MSNPDRRYKVRGIDGNIRTVIAPESSYIKDLVDAGLAVPSLPENPNPGIYTNEDMIYGGFRFDPENNQTALEQVYGKLKK